MDNLQLIGKSLAFFVPYACRQLPRRIAAIYHSWTYKSTSSAQNVVVLGGSFAGITLAKRLTETLPTGYKVVLVEKRSHFNYSFNFPRYSVLQGYEHTAFIPYDGLKESAPSGIYTHVQDTVGSISNTEVLLASGKSIPYRFLAIATGASQPLPVQVSANERDAACLELRYVQQSIKDSQKIAIIGAGAVGIELATDIKDFYPDKNVTLIHPYGQVLNRFGKRLHGYVLPVLEKLKIRCLFHERPSLPQGDSFLKDTTLTFSDGHQEKFDLVIGCTGQRPNSSLLTSLLPNSISEATSRILVQPTLQVSDTKDSNQRVFAFGDVAEHGGPMMARAGMFQAEVVLANIMAMIHGRVPRKVYTPRRDIEGAIKLTLGRAHNAIYTMDDDGSELLVVSHKGQLDHDCSRAWKELGADIKLAKPVVDSVVNDAHFCKV
ncbi:hypothetical protein AAFC00_004409 [Neodothiora populina]